MAEQIPNPGTQEAIDAGCACPIMDNRHGRGYFAGPDGSFIYNLECSLHKEEALSIAEEHIKDH